MREGRVKGSGGGERPKETTAQFFLNAVTFAGRLNCNKWRALAGRDYVMRTDIISYMYMYGAVRVVRRQKGRIRGVPQALFAVFPREGKGARGQSRGGLT